MTFGWVREEKELENKPKYEQDDGPLTDDQINQLKEIAQVPEEPIVEELIEEPIEPINCNKCGTELVNAPGIGLFCPNKECDVLDNVNGNEPVELVIHWPEVPKQVEEPTITIKQGDPDSDGFLKQHTMAIREPEPETVRDESGTPNFEGFKDLTTGEWVQTGPAFESINEEPVVDVIDTSHPYVAVSGDYVEYEGKRMHKRVLADLRPDLGIEVDNPTEPEITFGDNFPKHPSLGDMFTRIDVIPHRIFKFNGRKWIEVNRENTDSHLSEDGYIQHLIEKIDSGEYDPEHLTPAEQDAIAQFIKNNQSNI
jgi:hypothetical protein